MQLFGDQEICEVAGCRRPSAGAAKASRALGVAHCGRPGHRAEAQRRVDAALAAEGTYLLAGLRARHGRIFRDLCRVTAGRPRIAVDCLNGSVATDWAFLDVGRHADNREVRGAQDNAFLEFPKLVYRPAADPDARTKAPGAGGPRRAWQLLASRMRPDSAEPEWYRYFPLDWCLDEDVLARARARQQAVEVDDNLRRRTRRLLQSLAALHA